MANLSFKVETVEDPNHVAPALVELLVTSKSPAVSGDVLGLSFPGSDDKDAFYAPAGGSVPSYIALASEKYVVVFRTHSWEGQGSGPMIPESLRRVLESKYVLKAGLYSQRHADDFCHVYGVQPAEWEPIDQVKAAVDPQGVLSVFDLYQQYVDPQAVPPAPPAAKDCDWGAQGGWPKPAALQDAAFRVWAARSVAVALSGIQPPGGLLAPPAALLPPPPARAPRAAVPVFVDADPLPPHEYFEEFLPGPGPGPARPPRPRTRSGPYRGAAAGGPNAGRGGRRPRGGRAAARGFVVNGGR